MPPMAREFTPGDEAQGRATAAPERRASGDGARRVARGERPTAGAGYECRRRSRSWKPRRYSQSLHGRRRWQRGAQMHIREAPGAHLVGFFAMRRCVGVFVRLLGGQCRHHSRGCLLQVARLVRRHADDRVEEHGQQQQSGQYAAQEHGMGLGAGIILSRSGLAVALVRARHRAASPAAKRRPAETRCRPRAETTSTACGASCRATGSGAG